MQFEEYVYQGIPCYDFTQVSEKFNISGSAVRSYIKNYGRESVFYYPNFVINNGKEAVKTAVMFAENEADASVCCYVPKEVFLKLNYRIFSDAFSVSGDCISVSYEGTEYSLHCFLKDGEVYVPIRELADVFGFNVNFANNSVILSDEKISADALPATLNMYIISGVRFLLNKEVEPVLREKGLNGGLYPYAFGRERISLGYFVEEQGREGEEKHNEMRFKGASVPYLNNADIYSETQNRDKIMLMYDYFKNTGII